MIELGVPGFTYRDLFDPARLAALHSLFLTDVQQKNDGLFLRWNEYARTGGTDLDPITSSNLLVEMAPYVSDFVARLFKVEQDRKQLLQTAAREKVIFSFRRDFLQRRALKKFPSRDKCLELASPDALKEHYAKCKTHFNDMFISDDPELATARMAMQMAEYERTASAELKSLGDKPLEYLEAFLALSRWDESFFPETKYWTSYHLPSTLDFEHLVEVIHPDSLLLEKIIGDEKHYRRRDGFALTDERMNDREVRGETEYCVFCHDRSKDSCSKGFVEKDGAYRKNPLGIPLAGCPLDEKISEMHSLMANGDALGALSLVMIDNPMCPGTGHRICNDCMKACIYQKQTPVNIPQAETGALTDVLKMRWGVEIYGLLTRWNPLNIKRPVALPYNGKNVLVVGLGPAGYTLSQYLLNEGFGVVGIDGLKIEPHEKSLTGFVNEQGEYVPPKPIEYWSEIYHDLGERTMEGFGGVAEYGITVRWDKNFLSLMHITLARRSTFAIYGGVRFGGTVTIEDAFDRYNFDHIAIATGAGKPTIVPMKNNLIRGIRKASDFLMALQLTGAAKKTSMANLQIQLPAVVIGGGLTAIDTATEIAAYYPLQVEKILDRYDALTKTGEDEKFMSRLDHEEHQILRTFLDHGREVRIERERAKSMNEKPNFVPLVRKWGGVTIAYRRSLTDSPAYRLNHEEIEKSLEEGIYYCENLSPVEAVPDDYGAVKAMRFERQGLVDGKLRPTGEFVELPAKSVCVAAGTSPNTIYEREFPGTFAMDDKGYFFASYDLNDGVLVPSKNGFFTSYTKNGKYITFYGDNHPRYAGNVVKAMASAKDGYRSVVKAVLGGSLQQPADISHWNTLRVRLDDELCPKVHHVERLTKTIVEVVIYAPSAARHFHPGQFYRLQNYERFAPKIDNVPLTMEGLALTGAWVDKEKGLLSLIVLEMGSSSRLCAMLKKGEPVVVMGPTGAPTEIPENETVLLAGGGLGNAVLFSIAKALKERNNKVIYFAGYKNGEDLFKREEIESSTDQVVWSTDMGASIEPKRPQDSHFRGNIIEAMLAYQHGSLGVTCEYPLPVVDRIIAIGSDRMMSAVKSARRSGGKLDGMLKDGHTAIGSINSSMQCMMKEVCAQCLQKHVDPVTQEEKGFVFSCFNQDQPLDMVDFKNLNERLKTNSVEEKLSLAFFEHLLNKSTLEFV